MAKVERRGDLYTTRVTLVDPLTGQKKQRRITGRSSREVERAAAKLLSDSEAGTYIDAGRVTVEAFITERWLPHMAERVKPATITRYEGLFRVQVLPIIGEVQLRNLRPIHIQTVVDKVLASGRSARTTLHTYRVLSEALKQAVRWQVLAVNPATAVLPPRPRRPDLHIPDAEGVAAVVAASRGTSLELPVLLATATGMRLGEIVSLRWRDVDPARGVVHVNHLVRWERDGSFSFDAPKTPRARRTIPLPAFAVQALKEERKAQAERHLMAGESWQNHDMVLDSGFGLPRKVPNLSKGFADLRRTRGLPRMRFHDLRHAFATELLRASVHPKIVSEVLGHSSTSFTLDTYSHVLPGMADVAADTIQAAYGAAFIPQAPDVTRE